MKVWLFPRALSGEHRRRAVSPLLLFVLTAECLERQLLPLLEGMYGCHWYVGIDCGIIPQGLLYACVSYLQYSGDIPSVHGESILCVQNTF